MARQRTILLHAAAPPKPAEGAPCNGCGVCCAWQPCPAGMVVSASVRGPCRALAWDDAAGRYLCRLVSAPQALWPGLPPALQPLLARAARRWIAAGAGCDSRLEAGAG